MSKNESVWNILSKCGVCDKQLTEESVPQLLPCCHSACKECIEDQLAAIHDFIHTHNNDGSPFKCKICSQEYSPNDCIENTFQILHWTKNSTNNLEINDKKCQSCESNKSAVTQCSVCEWICDECLDLHIKGLKVFKDHEFDKNSKTENPLPKNMCSEHNEMITVYCKTCKTAYCARCILKDHNLHIYEDTKDSAQLKLFYDNLTKQVDQIKEKRSFTENTLEKFETIESDISEQKNLCIEKIKSITDKLHEKIAELGKSMLDKVNGLCQLKETEFTSKKTELNQLNNSFKYIEQFMSVIMQLNDPMAVMKAQDLLNNQLEKLLNKPCSHPDFIKPFKIEVIDDLEANRKGFSVANMIDGVFNMCFKLQTSDDPIEKPLEMNSSQNPFNDEDIVEIIPTPTLNNNSIQNSTQNISRGNRESQIYSNNNINNTGNNRKTKQSNTYAPNYQNLNNFQNAKNNSLQTQRISETQVTQRLQNNSCHSMHLQSLNTLTNSVPHTMQQMPNNFTQTGISTLAHNPVVTSTMSHNSYGNPHLYRGPVNNHLNQNSTTLLIPSTNQQNFGLNLVQYSSPPNITLPFNTNNVHQQQRPHQPIQQTPFNQNIRSFAGGTITAALPQQTYRSATVRLRQIQPNPQQITPIGTSNPHILYHLGQTQTPVTSSVPTDPRRAAINNIMSAMHQMRPPLQTPNNRTQTPTIQMANNITNNTINANNNSTPVNNTQTQRTSNSLPRDQTSPITSYHSQIPEQSIAKTVSIPTPPLISTEEQISSNSNELNINRRNSTHSCMTPTLTQNGTNHTIVSNRNAESVAGIPLRSQSMDSLVQTPLPSMPLLNEIPEEVTQTEPQTNNSEPTHTTEPPTVESVITQSSSVSNPTESVTNNKDENKENKESTASSRSTAPVARIAPITPEIDLSDARDDDLEDEAIDEDADCVVCSKEYGEFICCERCPRAFHIDCHVPELKKMPDSTFVCTFCKTIPTLQSNGRVKNKLGLNERQQAICERVLIGILCHRKSHHFKPPLSQSISNNLDFIIIKKKLENNKYEDETQFLGDVQQVFSFYNSRNNVNSEDKSDYKKVENLFKKLVKQFMPHYTEFSRTVNNREPTTPSTPKRNRTN